MFRRNIYGILAVLYITSFICIGGELAELLKEGEESNPAVLAAKWKVEQALLKHEELNEFFDPSMFAGIGRAEKARGIPGTSTITSLTNDSYDAQIGFEVPVNPGAYISFGGAKRLLKDPSGYDELYQTIYGFGIKVPLLRDREFKSLTLNRALAMAEYNMNVSNLLKVTQIMRRDIELAYITAYEKLSAYRVSQEATKRFQRLYDETIELCRMKVVSDYQIFSSKMELQIGREDEEKARVAFELSLHSLANAVGISRSLALAGDQKSLLDTAAQVVALPDIPEQEAYMARGSYLEIKNNIRYTQVQLDMAEEEKQDDLSINFGITAQGEHPNNPFEMKEILTDRRIGTEISLIWRRNIDYRGPTTRMARYRARIKELNENLRNIQLEISIAMQDAMLNFKGAKNRLAMVNEGIEAARNNLASQQERFRLGEATSTNVTDAQKNLTTILQRQTTATADLLRARAHYMFAIGYYQP